MKIPKYVHNRISTITRYVIDDGTQWTINRRIALRLFLAEIWLSETDDDGWVTCTARDIRGSYSSLLVECKIEYMGEGFSSTLAKFLPRLPDIDFRKGKSSKDPEKRKSGQWQFNPQCPLSASGEPEMCELWLVDLETGEAVKFKDLLKGNGKAPKHAIDLEKRQTELKQCEKVFLARVARGRMHISFVEALRNRVPDIHYRAGIRSLNHLYNAKIEGQYVTYDHHYRLTFGGRYYDQAFQNLPNELKSKFRSGLQNYDIEACNLACLNWLFREYELDYRVKSSIYKTMMEHTELTRKQCKQMVHTTTYRIGRVTLGVNDGLGEKVFEWCGNRRKKAVKILRWWDSYVIPLKAALETLLERVQDRHHKNCLSPRNYHRYTNAVGLILDLNSEEYLRKRAHHQQYARNKVLLAFIICGVEQAYIREVVRLNPGKVCMLDHDGVVATGALSLPDWRGFTMKVKD